MKSLALGAASQYSDGFFESNFQNCDVILAVTSSNALPLWYVTLENLSNNGWHCEKLYMIVRISLQIVHNN